MEFTFTRTDNRIVINDHTDDQPDPYKIEVDSLNNSLTITSFAGRKWYVNLADDTVVINEEAFEGTAEELKTALYAEIFKDNTGGGSGYLVYTALLNQTGTNAPTDSNSGNGLQNTLSGPVVWTRNIAGGFLGTLAGAFTENKTFFGPRVQYISPTGVDDEYIVIARASANVIEVNHYMGGEQVDEMTNVAVEIRVYP